MRVSKNWKRTDLYSLVNDQRMKNVDNLISPCGKVVSVFLIEEDPRVGILMFDNMFRDYKNTTPNLRLILVGKLKISTSILPVYILREKISKKAMVHIFVEIENKLYCLIFDIEKYEKSLKSVLNNNQIFKDVIKLLEENL